MQVDASLGLPVQGIPAAPVLGRVGFTPHGEAAKAS